MGYLSYQLVGRISCINLSELVECMTNQVLLDMLARYIHPYRELSFQIPHHDKPFLLAKVSILLDPMQSDSYNMYIHVHTQVIFWENVEKQLELSYYHAWSYIYIYMSLNMLNNEIEVYRVYCKTDVKWCNMYN